jgi:hypothetical protein
VSVPLLSPDQAEFIDAVARRVVELLEEREHPPAGLVDATTIAAVLGMSRSSVYEHAAEFGAMQLGTGSAPGFGSTSRRRVRHGLAATNANGPRPNLPSRSGIRGTGRGLLPGRPRTCCP